MAANWPVRLTASATAGIRAAALYFASERPGAEQRFQRAVGDALLAIAALPESFPVVRGELRRAVLKKFTYGVYFRIRDGEVRVVAVCHLRRDAKSWERRAND